MTDPLMAIFREYEPHELGADGYPRLWHGGLVPWGGDDDGPGVYIEDYGTRVEFRRETAEHVDVAKASVGVKDIVRMLAGHRCIRCRHPYRAGGFTWQDNSPAHMVGPIPSDALSLEGMRADAHGQAPGRATHWSPCGPECRHGAPVRVRNDDSDEALADGSDWRYSWPILAREALAVTDDDHGAGALVRDGKTVEAAWRILTVHHLNNRKHDLRWWNLVSLCQRCHLLIQKTVIMERVWPWEHDEWFKPYAAGWYAYAYLGENLSPSEVLLRMDELLALERMA